MKTILEFFLKGHICLKQHILLSVQLESTLIGMFNDEENITCYWTKSGLWFKGFQSTTNTTISDYFSVSTTEKHKTKQL